MNLWRGATSQVGGGNAVLVTAIGTQVQVQVRRSTASVVRSHSLRSATLSRNQYRQRRHMQNRSTTDAPCTSRSWQADCHPCRHPRRQGVFVWSDASSSPLRGPTPLRRHRRSTGGSTLERHHPRSSETHPLGLCFAADRLLPRRLQRWRSPHSWPPLPCPWLQPAACADLPPPAWAAAAPPPRRPSPPCGGRRG